MFGVAVVLWNAGIPNPIVRVLVTPFPFQLSSNAQPVRQQVPDHLTTSLAPTSETSTESSTPAVRLAQPWLLKAFGE